MEVILAVAFDREVDLQRGKDDELTQAAAHIFKLRGKSNPLLLVVESELKLTGMLFWIYVYHLNIYSNLGLKHPFTN